jgi:hypothetical protein
MGRWVFSNHGQAVMKTFVEKLLDANDVRPERAHGIIVVGPRAKQGELDELEQQSIVHPEPHELPMPFWEDYEKGILEITEADRRELARLGITPEEYEILVLEDRLDRT